MALDDTAPVKAQSKKKPNESENQKRKKKNDVVSNSKGQHFDEVEDEEEREEASGGCWVKFRFMIGCLPSKSDVDASSSSLYATTTTSTGILKFLPFLKAFPFESKKIKTFVVGFISIFVFLLTAYRFFHLGF